MIYSLQKCFILWDGESITLLYLSSLKPSFLDSTRSQTATWAKRNQYGHLFWEGWGDRSGTLWMEQWCTVHCESHSFQPLDLAHEWLGLMIMPNSKLVHYKLLVSWYVHSTCKVQFVKTDLPRWFFFFKKEVLEKSNKSTILFCLYVKLSWQLS